MRHVKLSYDEVNRIRGTRASPGLQESEEVEEERTVFEEVAYMLLTAFGSILCWRVPDIEGIGEFVGELQHAARYQPPNGTEKTWRDDSGRWKDKGISVTGSGSMVVDVATVLAQHVPKPVNYVYGYI